MYIFISLIKILFILVCVYMSLEFPLQFPFQIEPQKFLGGRTKDYSVRGVLRAALEFWPPRPQNFCRTHSFQFAFVLSIFGQLPAAPWQHVLPAIDRLQATHLPKPPFPH